MIFFTIFATGANTRNDIGKGEKEQIKLSIKKKKKKKIEIEIEINGCFFRSNGSWL